MRFERKGRSVHLREKGHIFDIFLTLTSDLGTLFLTSLLGTMIRVDRWNGKESFEALSRFSIPILKPCPGRFFSFFSQNPVSYIVRSGQGMCKTEVSDRL